MRGIVIAGTHSGSGKTTVALGIMAALRKRGAAVQPFKAGPDFIDAGLHGLATGRISRNLDIWMCGPEYVEGCFVRHASAADISVVEGVMGLYDGDRSTASLAALLDLPVVLVVDAYGMAESAGAVVQGFTGFGALRAERGPKFAGVVFNRVASESHFERLKSSVNGVVVLGYLPREADFEIPHRHLGLMTVDEDPLGSANIDKLADVVSRHMDIDAIVQAAGTGPAMPSRPNDPKTGRTGGIRLAVARDRAFCFYYEDNLDMLREAGAEIIAFSPLSDHELPAADMVYLGGGYPEVHAETLSRNRSMRASVRAWAEAGKPVYAECGGLMYLSQAIEKDGATYPMAEVLPFETRMLGRPRLGYREIALRGDGVLGRAGDVRRGHEFHYSEIKGNAAGEAYRVRDSRGKVLPDEGYQYRNVLASYVHLHFGNAPDFASHIISHIRGDRKI